MFDESILRNILKHITNNNTEINSNIDLFNSTVEELHCNLQVQKSNANAQKVNMESLHFKESKAIIKTEDTR